MERDFKAAELDDLSKGLSSMLVCYEPDFGMTSQMKFDEEIEKQPNDEIIKTTVDQKEQIDEMFNGKCIGW